MMKWMCFCWDKSIAAGFKCHHTVHDGPHLPWYFNGIFVIYRSQDKVSQILYTSQSHLFHLSLCDFLFFLLVSLPSRQ